MIWRVFSQPIEIAFVSEGANVHWRLSVDRRPADDGLQNVLHYAQVFLEKSQYRAKLREDNRSML
jgi:hypothetical protein